MFSFCILQLCHSLFLLCFYFVYYSYATAYTMYPVFSLVLDKDVSAETAMTYPELYKELVKVNRHQATLHKTHQIPYNAWKVYELLNDCTLHRQSIQAKK